MYLSFFTSEDKNGEKKKREHPLTKGHATLESPPEGPTGRRVRICVSAGSGTVSRVSWSGTP